MNDTTSQQSNALTSVESTQTSIVRSDISSHGTLSTSVNNERPSTSVNNERPSTSQPSQSVVHVTDFSETSYQTSVIQSHNVSVTNPGTHSDAHLSTTQTPVTRYNGEWRKTVSERPLPSQTVTNVTTMAAETPASLNHFNVTSQALPAAETFDFTTRDFVRCFRSEMGGYLSSGVYVTTNASKGRMRYDGKEAVKMRWKQCRIAVQAPVDMIVRFHATIQRFVCSKASVRVSTARSVTGPRLSEHIVLCGDYVSKEVTVNSNRISFEFKFFSFSPLHSANVVFYAINQSFAPKINITHVTQYKEMHAIMLTFLYLDTFREISTSQTSPHIVYVFLDGTSFYHNVLKAFGTTPPRSRVYDEADVMYIAMTTSVRYAARTGFKLLFTFHPRVSTPVQFPDGAFNCSVEYWSQLKDHFPCNLHADCADAEDEENCPYTSHLCGPGQFCLGDSCYFYVKPESRMTWLDASELCELRGAPLVSLNDAVEWLNVTSLLRQYRVSEYYTGLRLNVPSLPKMYMKSFQWTDGTIGYLYHLAGSGMHTCTLIDSFEETTHDFHYDGLQLPNISTTSCLSTSHVGYVCEKHTQYWKRRHVIYRRRDDSPPLSIEGNRLVVCPNGQLTQNFLSCDGQSACWVQDMESLFFCQPPMDPLPPMFTCRHQFQRVPYTLVCDFRPDCIDHSDESFCVFPQCPGSSFLCDDVQCIPESQVCDTQQQCVNGADELNCEGVELPVILDSRYGPGLVTFTGDGDYKVSDIDLQRGCPSSHFFCSGGLEYCLPVYVRCNDVLDCPHGEDEADCDSHTCPGLYHCRASTICVHDTNMCDGVFQCPQNDDELYCQVTCAHSCTCHGHAFFCTRPFLTYMYPDLRFLEAGGSGLKPDDVINNTMLIHLSLAFCNIRHFQFPALSNLHSLDVSGNRLTFISSEVLMQMKLLTSLTLSGNPLSLQGLVMDISFPFLRELDLSQIPLQIFNVSVLMNFPNVQAINLSHSHLDTMMGSGFNSLRKLRVVDLRGSPMNNFPHDLFHGLRDLQTVYADNYKLCCRGILPDNVNPNRCQVPFDEISSCETLLRSNLYRVLLVMFSVLALLCNASSLVYRSCFARSAKSGFGVFVSHLCVSDFLMGVYMAVIGVADRLYQGTYVWKDAEWRHSTACKMAGFLSLVSSEVSAFLICLITLDRFLVLRFPFSQLHFRNTSSHVACATVWCLGLFLAAVPLLPMTSHWDFYSHTGICIPLPVTRKKFAGQKYSFSIMIIMNFVLFLLIAGGQGVVYYSIQRNRMSSTDSTQKSKDQTIARRLITVVMSDFLCWFPIGVLGLLASHGVMIPGEVSVFLAIIILPLNASLNPFLYTLNLLLDRRRRTKEVLREKRLMSQLQAKNSSSATSTVDKLALTYTKEEIGRLMQKWFADKSLPLELVSSITKEVMKK